MYFIITNFQMGSLNPRKTSAIT